MEDEYGIGDLRSYYTHQPVSSSYPYDMLMFRTDSVQLGASGGGGGGFQMGGGGGGDGGTARWPRQETLSLLEIRSRLDSKFKEANQKGPLWDEVSRIMCEEYGYQRSGKKCREKFENLYKYYKKTKDGKGGRQDGKHYRFFRQLEALYGDHPSNSSTLNSETPPSSTHFPYNNFPINNNNNPVTTTTTISVPNSSDYDTISSDCSVEDARNKKRKGLKAKIKESIDEQMKKLMEKQETWMQKMVSIIETKEEERVLREEQWRKQDAARIDREHKAWANERAWIQSRDVGIMEAFHKLANKSAETESAVSNYLLKCSNKRKEDSTDSIIGINDQRGVMNGCDEQINESCFRYFVGDSYGRL